MKHQRSMTVGHLIVAGLFFSSVPSVGAESAPFAESTNVIEVGIPVTVTSRDGQPVRGLGRDDFEILDNGRVQKLTDLRVVDLGAGDEATPSAPLEARPASDRRHFLLLFDLSFANPVAILKARLAARDFVLQALHPEDLAAVAAFSLETGPRLVITFTSDRAQLARAIDTLDVGRRGADVDPLRFFIDTARGSSDVSSESTLRDSRNKAQAALLEDRILQAKQAETVRKSFDRSQVTAWSRALGEMARTLAIVPGRKQVIYFSEGFDSRLMLGRRASDVEEQQTDSFNAEFGDLFMVDSDDTYGNSKLQGDIQAMLNEFRRADCVIQAVNTSGLKSDGDLRDPTRDTGDDALFVLADGTGGELFRNANDLRTELTRVLLRSSVTYVLAFQPDGLKLDGAYHRLKVTLKADQPRGTRVSFRMGYYAPRPFSQLGALEKDLLASDAIVSAVPKRDIPVHVLAPPFRAAEAAAYVPVVIEIEGKALLDGATGNEMTVELYAYVTNEAGEMRDYFAQKISFDLRRSREALSLGGVKYYGHLGLAPGRHLLRVLVRNSQSGRTGVETAEIEVPAFGGHRAVLLPPLFIEAPGRWVMVKENAASTGQGSVVYPFIVKGEPFLPSARPHLPSEELARLCLVGYDLAPGEIELRGHVAGADGEAHPGGRLTLVERTATGLAGVDKLLADFTPENLPSGEYSLQVELVSASSGSIWSPSLPFTVER